MSKTEIPSQTPITSAFRSWVQSALTDLGLRPAAVSLAIGASVNFLGVFLRDPERDIRLGTAATVERHLRKVAGERGVDLPPIGQMGGAA